MLATDTTRGRGGALIAGRPPAALGRAPTPRAGAGKYGAGGNGVQAAGGGPKSGGGGGSDGLGPPARGRVLTRGNGVAESVGGATLTGRGVYTARASSAGGGVRRGRTLGARGVAGRACRF